MTVRMFDYEDFTSGSRIVLDEDTLDTFRAGGFLTGAITIAITFQPVGSTTESTQFLFSMSSSGSLRFGISYSTSGGVLQVYIGGVTRTFTGVAASNGTWFVAAVRKDNGTATPQIKLWNGDTGAVVADWTNANGTLDNDNNLPDEVQIGNRVNDFPANAKIAGIALWSSALDNTVGGTLGTGFQEWLDASPIHMWVLDQANVATAVTDLIGNADQTAITDTSVDTGDDPTVFDISLGGGATDLVALDAAHGQTAESPTLTQVHVIEVHSASHAQTADAPALSVVHVLAPSDAVHAQAADSPALTQVHVLSSEDALHAQTAESPALIQAHNLIGEDAVHAHAAEQPAITQSHAIAAEDAAHFQTADQPDLTLDGAIVAHSASHVQTADSPALTQLHTLASENAQHTHTAESSVLAQEHIVEPDDAIHAQAAEAATLDGAAIIEAHSAAHAHTADIPSLTQLHLILVNSAVHSQTADSPFLNAPSVAAYVAVAIGEAFSGGPATATLPSMEPVTATLPVYE